MPTANELNTLHRIMGTKFGSLLSQPVKIKSHDCPSQNLPNLKAGGRAGFELGPTDGLPVIAEVKGRRRDVFPLLPMSLDDDKYEPRCWVGWHEIWQCRAKNDFGLQVASWTLYWGWANEERMTQIVRAEWDQIHRLEASASAAGHPHWHVDTMIVLPSLDSITAPEELVAAESPRFDGKLNISKMHLAMGGWRNSENSKVPDCWQCDFNGVIDELADWGERTLRYLQSQADLIRAM